MLKVELIIPNIKVGVPADDGVNIRLYKLKSDIDLEAKYKKMDDYRWYSDEKTELITDVFSPDDAERFLTRAKKDYTLRVKSVESCDVYSTYNVEPGEDPPKYTECEIGYENLVIHNGELFGILYNMSELIKVLFPLENPEDHLFGVNRHVSTVRYGGQPLDYFVSTITTVEFIKNEG